MRTSYTLAPRGGLRVLALWSAAAASAENAATYAALDPPNYTVSGAKGTFVETAGSGPLQLTDASSNTIFSLTPQVSLAPGASITLLYTTTFNNSILGLAAGRRCAPRRC
jgi:hypothetical protein